MALDLVGAIVGGLAGIVAMTALMMMTPKMGMPEMDMPRLLGSMFGAPGSKAVGMAMHFMAGVVFAIVYGLLFTLFPGSSVILLGLVFGIVHWLIAGLMIGVMMPMMHAGVKSGDVPAPGLYMGGMKAFVGGLMGHILFGVVVGLVYGLIAG